MHLKKVIKKIESRSFLNLVYKKEFLKNKCQSFFRLTSFLKLSRNLTIMALFMVATQPAINTLPDGRNTHLIIEPVWWWLPKLRARFIIDQHIATREGFTCRVRPVVD